MDPGNPKIISGLLRCLVQIKKYDDAKEMMGSLDDEILKNEDIVKINKLLSSLDEGGDNDIEELKSIVANEPNNKEKDTSLQKNIFYRAKQILDLMNYF